MNKTLSTSSLSSRFLDGISNSLLPVISWFPLIMAALTVAVVSLRYGLGVGAITAQEGVIYLHSALFLLGASCTLGADGHVRVDIFYRRFSDRQKAWVNALGHTLFTLPLCLLIGITCWGYVNRVLGHKGSLPRARGYTCYFHTQEPYTGYGSIVIAASNIRDFEVANHPDGGA